ncbi:hypothetical protein OAE57_01080 [Synechococcus sp. AH-551-C10]|nr:hypothetical protein [Synechococcus sp. AH-551-C10]MDB4659646.1 hypothetical protein [Synechococcus sp. AH-551-C10]
MTVHILSDVQFLDKLREMNFCRYNSERKLIEITEEVHSDDFYYGLIYRKLVKFLTTYSPEGDLFDYPKASEVILSYYSGCLLRYVFEVLDSGIDFKDTCWHKKCENSRLIGYVGNTFPCDLQSELSKSTLKDTNKLLRSYDSLSPSFFSVEGGWLKYCDPQINHKIFSLSERIKSVIRVILRGPYDRSLSIISRIRNEGFDETAAYGIKQGVFGFSQKSLSYSVFHGKHRVVALMYLVNKGILPPDLEIKYPTVSYPFHHFANSSGKKCDTCGSLRPVAH